MRTRSFFIPLIFLIFSLNLQAHEGGHDTGNASEWNIEGNTVEASFLAFKDGLVFLETKTGKLLIRELSSFSKQNRLLIVQKNDRIKNINQFSGSPQTISTNQHLSDEEISINVLLIALSLAAILFSLYWMRRKKVITASMGVVSILVLIVLACSNDATTEDDNSTSASVPSNDILFMQSLFENFTDVTTFSDDTYFHIASNGLPSHNMMVGITSWQQQVPISHSYTGDNSWFIPIQPELSDNPLSTQTNLLKGAIAVAVNGIPIFNPLNNRGEDANAIGELDQWGGHCGRADDYHYHLPPTHLQSTVGEGMPLAYAVDGFPVYGETTEELDEYLGKFNDDGSYQYHTIQNYPYFIAGMRGKVILDPSTTAPENQVIPQAFTSGVRPALTPLQGAEIVAFESTGENNYSLTYTLNSENYRVNYNWDTTGLYTYEFVNPDGTSNIETYQR